MTIDLIHVSLVFECISSTKRGGSQRYRGGSHGRRIAFKLSSVGTFTELKSSGIASNFPPRGPKPQAGKNTEESLQKSSPMYLRAKWKVPKRSSEQDNLQVHDGVLAMSPNTVRPQPSFSPRLYNIHHHASHTVRRLYFHLTRLLGAVHHCWD